MADKIDKPTREIAIVLGRHLRRVRERKGLQRLQVAEEIGMDPSNLAKIEAGQKNVTIDSLRRIAEALGMEVVVRLRPKR